jgi:hypothetical protein
MTQAWLTQLQHASFVFKCIKETSKYHTGLKYLRTSSIDIYMCYC